jgi:predicted small secreted protein
MRTLMELSGIKLVAMLTVVVIGTFSLTGCNTVEGAGKDIERAGEEIQKAAD